MPFQSDLTPEEEAEFKTMQVGTTEPEPVVAAVVEPVAEPVVAAVVDPVVEPVVEAPKPGEPGSKHRADGTFKSAEELATDATAIAEAEASAPKPQKMVPHQALHESREREKAALQRAQLIETRMNAILAAKAQEAPALPAMPDLTTSPVAYLEALRERQDRMDTERQEQEQFTAIDQAFTQDEETFKQIQPDYEDAASHYLQSRYAELSQFYPQQQIQKMLFDEVRQIAMQSWNAGRPAAQTVYALASARGYRPAEPGEVVAQPTPTPTPAPTPSPTPAPAPTPAQIVAAAAAGQVQSRTLSGGNGATTTQLNAEAVVNMSDEQFDEYLKAGTKGADTRFQALFGG